MSKILAIDPATKCGWAYLDGGLVASGTWDLSIRRDESAGMRLIRLRSKLREFSPSLVVFEAARHAAPKMQGALTIQAQLQSVIVVHCEDSKIEYRGYSPSEIKKAATGKGNAGKGDMILAAGKLYRDQQIKDDNQADALCLLALANSEYATIETGAAQ